MAEVRWSRVRRPGLPGHGGATAAGLQAALLTPAKAVGDMEEIRGGRVLEEDDDPPPR